MAETKHTPGPWEANEDRSVTSDFVFIVETSAGEKLRVSARESKNGYESAQANAVLIAAAPDLLDALTDLTDDIAGRYDLDSPSTNPGIKFCVERARAALAKASPK